MLLEISQNSQENTCASVSFLSCEFCEISKNIFLIEHIRATASVIPLYVVVTVNASPSLLNLLCDTGSRCKMLHCNAAGIPKKSSLNVLFTIINQKLNFFLSIR